MVKLNLPEQSLNKLCEQLGSDTLDILGFSLDVKAGSLEDTLCAGAPKDRNLLIFTIMLAHYTQGKPTELTSKLVKFKDLPGGYAYEGAFNQRAIKPVAEDFGAEPDLLVSAAKLLGGAEISLGGDVSVRIPTLKGIPLTYILWKKEEFDATATILYNESASSYLPTEDLSGIGELTTSRLSEAKQRLEHG